MSLRFPVACGLGLVLAASSFSACSSSNSNPSEPAATDDSGEATDSGTKKKKDAGKTSTTKTDSGPKQCDPYAVGNPSKTVFIGPSGLQTLLVNHIKSATQSIDIMIYELDAQGIVDALEEAQGRGVKVRFVIDHSDNTVGENKKARDQLTAAGVEFTDAPPEFVYQHAKVMIFDGEKAIVMSANLNGYSMSSERNYGVVTTEVGEVADLQAVFDRDRAGGGDLSFSCSKLVVSPENSKERLLALIDSAKTSLDLELMYLTDNDIEAAVTARAAAGVSVRALLANPAWMKDNPATAALLQKASIPVKYYTKLEVHAKLLIADGIAFVGSENMSLNSLSSNREIGVFVSEPSLSETITKQFETDWAAGVDP